MTEKQIKYKVFDTEEEANAAEALICAECNFPKPGVNAKTGQIEVEKQFTTRWAIPVQINDGRWIFPSIDDTGEIAGDDWFPEPDPLAEP